MSDDERTGAGTNGRDGEATTAETAGDTEVTDVDANTGTATDTNGDATDAPASGASGKSAAEESTAANGDADANGEASADGRSGGDDSLRRGARWLGIGIAGLVALVACVSLYGAVGTLISQWVDPRYRPLYEAAFDLVVLLLAAAVVARLARGTDAF